MIFLFFQKTDFIGERKIISCPYGASLFLFLTLGAYCI